VRIRYGDYYKPNAGVVVQDLHDENAVISPMGSLRIFDPVPTMVKQEDLVHGGMLSGLNPADR